MSSSVSSEHAFSQGRLTISKCRSRLKGDIVEALQFMKCAIQQDLLFQEPAPSSRVEVEENSNQEPDNMAAGEEPGDNSEVEALSWDARLLIEEDMDWSN